MLLLPAADLPDGPAWTYQLKLDGYRALASLQRLLKNSFAGHGHAPQKLQVIDPPLWGGAMRCQQQSLRVVLLKPVSKFDRNAACGVDIVTVGSVLKVR
jgi:hypothetical protein